jgi:predicted transcriptional regulator
MAKDLTAIRIEGESIEQLKRIAREGEGLYFDRSVNWLIGQAVKEFIERHKAEKRAEKQSADVDLDRKPVIATKRDRKR